MKRFATLVVLTCACHAESDTRSSASPSTPIPASSSAAVAAAVAFDAPLHFKSGARAQAGDVVFTLQMLPKLIVSGPQPEIEQLQIDVTRGSEHGLLQVDTRNKRAEWGGVVFELGYADVYHDDIELTVHRK